MKEEVRRIMNLVKDGKLSPEDAAELIDAFVTTEGSSEGDVPPPIPPEADPSNRTDPKDPFRSFVDFVEGIGKEVSDGVNWKDVAQHVRKAADRGVEGIKSGVEQIKQGKVNFSWFSAQETRDIAMDIRVPVGKTLKVENTCGNIKVTGGNDSSKVTARAFFRGATQEDAKSKADAYTIIVEESEHQVLIRQPDVSGLAVDLVIQLAEKVNVEARTQAGEIRLLDTAMGCRANSQAGDIHLRGLKGPIEVSTQSGDIFLEDCDSPSTALEAKHGDISLVKVKGNVNARTAGGDIRGRNCEGSTYSIESVSGDVSLDFSAPLSGMVNIRTVNGNSEAFIVDGCDCRVSLSTLKGSVACEVTLGEEAKSEQRVTGRLGSGSGVLDLSGVNGNVGLKLRDSTT